MRDAGCFSTRLAMVDLPEPDSPVNHRTHGFWPFCSGARRLVDVELLPGGCWWPGAGAKSIMPAPTVSLVQPVDQDEGAGLAVLRVGIEGDRPGRARCCRSRSRSDRRVLAAACSRVLTSTLCFSVGDRARSTGLGADLQQVLAPGQQRLVAHPQQVDGELVGDVAAAAPAATSTSPRLMSISSVEHAASPPGRRRLVEVAVHR